MHKRLVQFWVDQRVADEWKHWRGVAGCNGIPLFRSLSSRHPGTDRTCPNIRLTYNATRSDAGRPGNVGQWEFMRPS